MAALQQPSCVFSGYGRDRGAHCLPTYREVPPLPQRILWQGLVPKVLDLYGFLHAEVFLASMRLYLMHSAHRCLPPVQSQAKGLFQKYCSDMAPADAPDDAVASEHARQRQVMSVCMGASRFGRMGQ